MVQTTLPNQPNLPWPYPNPAGPCNNVSNDVDVVDISTLVSSINFDVNIYEFSTLIFSMLGPRTKYHWS